MKFQINEMCTCLCELACVRACARVSLYDEKFFFLFFTLVSVIHQWLIFIYIWYGDKNISKLTGRQGAGGEQKRAKLIREIIKFGLRENDWLLEMQTNTNKKTVTNKCRCDDASNGWRSWALWSVAHRFANCPFFPFVKISSDTRKSKSKRNQMRMGKNKDKDKERGREVGR